MLTRWKSLGLVALLLLAGLNRQTATAQQQAQKKTYVGSEMCGTCHQDHPGWLEKSVHAAATLTLPDGTEVEGCETCHGPGSAHAESVSAEDIITFRLEPAETRSRQCLQCHQSREPTLNFRHSDHNIAKVACDRCHAGSSSQAFHSMPDVGKIIGQTDAPLCLGCHTDKRAEFNMPFHHPVQEGLMRCSACHEPHGTFTARLLRQRGTDVVCGKCHEDKVGPFIFEHPVGRAAECTACHQPHGSTNSKMLVRAQVRFLCLECHTNTPSFHDLTQRSYQNCTVCHVRVHGSNLNRLLFE